MDNLKLYWAIKDTHHEDFGRDRVDVGLVAVQEITYGDVIDYALSLIGINDLKNRLDKECVFTDKKLAYAYAARETLELPMKYWLFAGRATMADLIDRKALIMKLLGITLTTDLYGQGLARGIDLACCFIKEAEVVDAVPVVHGEWQYGTRIDGYWDKGKVNDRCRCSNCSREFNVDNLNCWWWCPQCGAKMDAEGGNEEA